jgi:hypothetical protein
VVSGFLSNMLEDWGITGDLNVVLTIGLVVSPIVIYQVRHPGTFK